MGILGGGGGDSAWTHKALMFGMVFMFLLPTMINIYCPGYAINVDQDELFDGYYEMTGQQASTKTAIWALTGIYEPVIEGSPYGRTDDGWLYSSRIQQYTPSQYEGTDEAYAVYRDSTGVYRYYNDSADYNPNRGTGHQGLRYWDSDTNQYVERTDTKGDLYTSVQFDVEQKSNIFFTEANKTVNDDGTFYYQYTGYRMAFQPISNYTTLDGNGDRVPVIATTTSCSLIWYQWYTSSGIASAMVLSGSSGGTSYINGAQIVSAFNNLTNTATFDMVFNGGITVQVHIQIDSYYLSTMTVQDCYDNGFWSIMITSESADSDAYTGTDFSLNPVNVLNTMIDLMTFNYDDYNLSNEIGILLSILFVIPLYGMLITLCLTHEYLYILVGILGVLQSLNFFHLFG